MTDIDVTVLPYDRILALGDSITEAGGGSRKWTTEPAVGPGWFAHVTRAGHGGERHLEFVNRGVGGNRVPDLLARLDADVIAAEPTLVLVYIGINDVWHFRDGRGTPEEEYRDGLREVVDRLLAAGLRVLLCTPTVIGEQVEGTNVQDAMLTTYTQINRDVAAATGVPLCDLHAAFRAELARVNADDAPEGVLTTDGVHLSEAGNALVATTIGAAIGLH
ncbi:MAG TPA: SGNH/GDSL hydrolase family protein [Actinopolymorphaceae bacterium]|jgi:lysophospholipase L1-like esterase